MRCWSAISQLTRPEWAARPWLVQGRTPATFSITGGGQRCFESAVKRVQRAIKDGAAALRGGYRGGPRHRQAARIHNPGAGRAVVGRESPRATTLQPRRLRAALHPLWHPLELRCACLEPRPALVTCAPTAAFNPAFLLLTCAHYLCPCLCACVCVQFTHFPGRIHALTTSGDAGSASDGAVRDGRFFAAPCAALRYRCACTHPAARSSPRHT